MGYSSTNDGRLLNGSKPSADNAVTMVRFHYGQPILFEEFREMICRICNEEFRPEKRHPGYINVCLDLDCREAANTQEVPLVLEQNMVNLSVVKAYKVM